MLNANKKRVDAKITEKRILSTNVQADNTNATLSFFIQLKIIAILIMFGVVFAFLGVARLRMPRNANGTTERRGIYDFGGRGLL